MAAGQAQESPLDTQGRPSAFAFAAGRALNLRWFVPALTDPKHHLENDIVAKERPRARCIPIGDGKSRPQLYTPAKTEAWETHVGERSLEQLRTLHLPGQDFVLPVQNARVMMAVRFNLRKPASYPKSVVHHVKKPDVDNLVKAILDGLVRAGVLGDDSLLTDLTSCKRYVSLGHPAGVEIDLTAIGL